MEELIKAFKEAEMAEYKYIGIGITEPGYIKPKIIIIPKENITKALETIKYKYDNNLKQKDNPDIKINLYMYSDDVNEIIQSIENQSVKLAAIYKYQGKEFVTVAIATYKQLSKHDYIALIASNPLTNEDVTILITIGAEYAVVNGENLKLDSPAFIENDRTYTPIRFISEHLGASVEWLENEQKVIITKNLLAEKNN